MNKLSHCPFCKKTLKIAYTEQGVDRYQCCCKNIKGFTSVDIFYIDDELVTYWFAFEYKGKNYSFTGCSDKSITLDSKGFTQIFELKAAYFKTKLVEVPYFEPKDINHAEKVFLSYMKNKVFW